MHGASLATVSWEPTAQEIEEKLIEMAYAWGDIEESLDELVQAGDDDFMIPAALVTTPLKKAFRVEARYAENGFGDPCSIFAMLFDVADPEGRKAARKLEGERGGLLAQGVTKIARPWHSEDYLEILQVPRSSPVGGQIDHPLHWEPGLRRRAGLCLGAPERRTG